MSAPPTAAAWACRQVDAVRDEPAGRLELLARTYRGPIGWAPQHLPFRRAALSFMRWQVKRGVLAPLNATPPGSPWWRAVNERLLRDGCEAVSASAGVGGPASSPTIEMWMTFISDPTPGNWYRAPTPASCLPTLNSVDWQKPSTTQSASFSTLCCCACCTPTR